MPTTYAIAFAAHHARGSTFRPRDPTLRRPTMVHGDPTLRRRTMLHRNTTVRRDDMVRDTTTTIRSHQSGDQLAAVWTAAAVGLRLYRFARRHVWPRHAGVAPFVCHMILAVGHQVFRLIRIVLEKGNGPDTVHTCGEPPQPVQVSGDSWPPLVHNRAAVLSHSSVTASAAASRLAPGRLLIDKAARKRSRKRRSKR